MKKVIRKITPEKIINFYHFTKAHMCATKYGHPSRQMVVIGVTGTKGKTSTCNFIHSVLNAAGRKAGVVTSANIKIGLADQINKFHMTMPSSCDLQQILKKMADVGCSFAIVEVTSEGIKQSRHKGIDFDIVVFTNLTPEHLPSHGNSFDQYKKEKFKLFSSLSSKEKFINKKKVDKAIVVNADCDEANVLMSYRSDKKFSFSVDNESDFKAQNISAKDDKISFKVNEASFSLNIPGKFNVYNALPAIVIGKMFGISEAQIEKGLASLRNIPGRMERIRPDLDFTVMVDYAHEKQSMSQVLKWAKEQAQESARIILLLGAEGGGRDKAKRAQMGELAGEIADYVVVTNVDPYEDDPLEIIDDIAKAVEKKGKKKDKDLFLIEDRRKGIAKALSLAKSADVVLITGKGAEQSMIIGGKKIAWDDRRIVREEIDKTFKKISSVK
ncbi:MAG: UDP-N-acetylmuramoyl-L-alanyl-D-glutamate--2,6-diaminopimelate ligase [candidate division WS2 bacterium ADurb.Bin280]|uniref:UDP-N-acetylmuramoyl-L-alanyl-D-glutamate--2, 6-diaminopimelate ligase n=1 Tax=candidate division WS2 bacterium ADurb.Bin280 TaxID=1852829 RepID=A0A1V5SCD4_9BACT|nr:MAG: UDP-N-acetylmuramoyl-L-alanyl-D-glutamate--2,6-diaminopimelate ligase [candidate division WS2 bacterium ADurb.Bin280]